jgi:hypothetical protein
MFKSVVLLRAFTALIHPVTNLAVFVDIDVLCTHPFLTNLCLLFVK